MCSNYHSTEYKIKALLMLPLGDVGLMIAPNVYWMCIYSGFLLFEL